MFSPQNPRRVLLVGNDADVQGAFVHPQLRGWETVTADNSAAAALLQQSNPCDVLLATQVHYQEEALEGIVWLTRHQTSPILFLADLPPQEVANAYERGVSLWLPRKKALQYPHLLRGALLRLALWAELQARQARTRESLEQCHRQVDRLISLLWRTAPLEAEKHWYTHRHMLERLHEELARSKRHGTPLTIALGEVHPQPDVTKSEDTPDLADWTATRLAAKKRSCDIMGQYGLQGFMLLMTHTPPAGGVTCCRRLQQYLEKTADGEPGPRGPVRAYFGVTSYAPGAETAQRLLRYAEEHLEAAKHNRSERVVGDEALVGPG